MPRAQKSEIFDLYIKESEKEGLIKTADALSDYKNDSKPRAGSDDISTIEALYGVKPEGQDYEFNIVEKAHPKAVIVAPAYDKLNALVENINERHNIMVNIVNKPATGIISHHKYAKTQLLSALVRIANDMDNRDCEELRALADNCIEKLK
jgi:hypothetical protein